MEKKLPKVLMLGWEFPPIINGGLGVACHDLAISMSEFADITMIIPKAAKGHKINKLNLIGLNNIYASNKIDSEQNSFRKNVSYVDSDLNPYYSEVHNDELQNSNQLENENKDEKTFDFDNLYGGDVINKVLNFSKLATKVALTKEFDVIHAHDWMTMLAGVEIKKCTNKPLVVHVHSLEVDRGGEQSKGWVYQTEKYCMEQADLLIPVSNFTGELIKKHYNIKADKIAPVHNGIRKVIPFKRKRKYKEKTVLFVGRLTRQKGPEFFLDIAEQTISKCPNVRFVVAGAGDAFKRIIKESARKSIGNKIHFTGFLNTTQLNSLWATSDVYLMPSVSEPFGLSAVEAAQFGIPCVISKQSGVSEVLTGSLKFDFWDTRKAADCIINLLNNKSLVDNVKSHAFNNLEHISWDIAAQKVMDEYRRNNILPN